MKANVGKIDKGVRLVLALALLSLFVLLQGDSKWLGLLGFVPLLTGLINWCPLYTLFGVSTCKR
ncbi:MAG: DUF2892 domain-containing protein [Burkholderiaceae bacterium]|nr:DUF2892 domain-containing protein [Burkholderiaceae bacterium]